MGSSVMGLSGLCLYTLSSPSCTVLRIIILLSFNNPSKIGRLLVYSFVMDTQIETLSLPYPSQTVTLNGRDRRLLSKIFKTPPKIPGLEGPRSRIYYHQLIKN